MNFPAILSRIKRRLPRVLLRKLPRKIIVQAISPRHSGALNLLYRRKRATANVLSFRYGNDYGEILVCPVLIRHEAREQGNAHQYQMTWMIVHGILHLAGMHHEELKATARRFKKLEEDLLIKLFHAP